MRREQAAPFLFFLCLFIGGCETDEHLERRSDDYLLAVDTPVGIAARRDVLEAPSALDENRIQLAALRILLSQDDEDGSWEQDATATGHALLDLHALGLLSNDDPAVKRAVRFLLKRYVQYLSYESDSPAWGKNWVALYALNRWGYGEELRVSEVVHVLLANLDTWLGGADGHAASAILRAITIHPLLEKRENLDRIVEALSERQLPSGVWDLGPGTGPLAVLAALLPLADDPRVMQQVRRFLPAVLSAGEAPVRGEDPILSPDEAHLTLVQALKRAGKLDSYRKGDRLESELTPYVIALYEVAGAGERGHVVDFQGRSITVRRVPVLLGTDIAGMLPVYSPDEGEAPLLRLLLGEKAQEKLNQLPDDDTVEVALVLRGSVIAVRKLMELRDGEGLAVKGLAEEHAAGLAEAVSKIEGEAAAGGDANRDR